jgi:hypothetical protein
MGLRNQPEFEAAETETTTEGEVMTTETKQDAGVAATTAIAAAAVSSTAVAAPRQATKLTLAFADKHGVFDVATVEGLGLAVPRIKGEQGSFFNGDEDLGSVIQFEVVSINPRTVIGTGTDDKEAKDFFRVSYDGVTISGESTTVDAYLDSLKAQGFDKAKKSEYLDIFGFIVATEKKGDIPVDARELCSLQCSPTSKGAFVAFTTTRGLLESRGVAKPLDLIEVHAEKRVSGSNKFTNFSFHAPKAK